MRVSQKLSLITAIVAVAGVTACSASAEALKPWWHLTSDARPTHLHSGVAQSAVYKFTTTEEFYLEEPVKISEGVIVPGVSFVGPFSPVEPAGEVEAGLEELFGAGNVKVESDVPGEYTVAFTGERADQAVGLTGELTPSNQSLTLTQVTEGRSDGEIVAFAENLGDANVDGTTTPVRITDTLPEHIKAAGVVAVYPEGSVNTVVPLPCTLESGSSVSCTLTSTLVPYEQIEVRIAVDVEGDAHSGEENEVDVSGGGAPVASLKRPLTISDSATTF